MENVGCRIENVGCRMENCVSLFLWKTILVKFS